MPRALRLIIHERGLGTHKVPAKLSTFRILSLQGTSVLRVALADLERSLAFTLRAWHYSPSLFTIGRPDAWSGDTYYLPKLPA